MNSSLVVDIGNTQIKLGVFSKGKFKHQHIFQKSTSAINYITNHKFDGIIVSSVGKVSQELTTVLNTYNTLYLSHTTKLPVKNNYRTPESLGVDRIAGVVGANALFPHVNNLVIDMGTCITYDYIDAEGIYWGGGISPGMNLRFRAMSDHTVNLPNAEFDDPIGLLGNTTITCIQSGVINGICEELNGIINRYQSEKGDINVILCGGDANSFESKIKAHIFASPKLVLIGLNRILEYNENN